MPTLVSTGQITINDNNDGMTVYLSNEGMTLPAGADGTVTDYTGASTTFYVYLGPLDDSGSWTVVAAPSTGVVGAFGTGPAIRTYTVTSLTVDSAYVDFTASKIGTPDLTRRFSLSRAKAGAKGDTGSSNASSGISRVKAYCASITPTTTTAPAATTGINSLPSVNQGGIVGTWIATTPSLVSGQYLYICEGSYSPTTDQVTWGIPYWATLRVGKLSTLATDTGTLNVSEGITTTNGNFSVDSTGLATFKSINIVGGNGQSILAAGESALRIAAMPSGVLNTEAQFSPAKLWEFRNTMDGWTVSGATVVTSTDVVTITSAGNDPIFRSPYSLNIVGAVNTKVRARVRRIAGSAWDGNLYFTRVGGPGEGVEGSGFTSTQPAASGAWTVLEWDMSGLTGWTNNIIDRIRIDLGNGPSDVFDVDWISIGKYGPVVVPSDSSSLNNLVNLDFWVRDGTMPWAPNGNTFNRLVMTNTDVAAGGPKGPNDIVWYCKETINDGRDHPSGGWENVPITLDTTKTYRFVVPMKRLSGTAGGMYWGLRNVADLNTTSLATGGNNNPYFAIHSSPNLNEWYLFVGYIFPAGSTGNTSDGAGVYRCLTGSQTTGGTNFNFLPGTPNIQHRAYMYYASLNAEQIFGRPMINVVDGTEPSLREYFSSSAVLNNAQQWSDVGGYGKAADFATVGPADAATTLGFNPQFSQWPDGNNYPVGWIGWVGNLPTRETSTIRTPPYAVKYTVSADTGMMKDSIFSSSPLYPGDYVQGAFDINIVTDNGGGYPGYLVRLYVNAACTVYRDTRAYPPAKYVNTWQRVPFTASVLEGEQIYGMTLYQMAAWNGMPGGVMANGSVVIFDNLTFDFRKRIGTGNVSTFVEPNAITDTQFGGNLKSSNWNGATDGNGVGWLLERSTGNFYGGSVKLRGATMSGPFTSWGWPASTAPGYYLGSEGLLMGNYATGKYFEVTSDGNIYTPGLTIENAAATFRGTLGIGAVAAGSLSSLTTSIGTLRARTGGGRTEIADDIIRVYDGNGALRVRIGNLGL